jgi:transcriptional regulator with XRE-family HTH domain
MTLAKRIRDSRYAKGWGPDELASRAEISRTALYQIESGKTETPRAGTLRRIAKALGVTTDALLGNEPLTLGILRGEEPSPGAGREVAALERKEAAVVANPQFGSWLSAVRSRDLERKLHMLLDSPLGEGVARIIEESYRLLPVAQGRAMS